MATVSNLNVKIGADASGLKKGLNDAQKAIGNSFNTNPVKNFNAEIGKSAKSISGLVGNLKTMATVSAGLFGMKEMIGGIVEAGNATYQLSQRLHLSAKEAGLLKRTLSMTGGDADSMASAMMRLQKSYFSTGESGDKCRAILQECGVALTDQNGKLLPLNEQLANLADGYTKAAQAGYEQEFILNTLGVKGMSLVSTLEQYKEASENAAKVKGVGLNPEEMHQLDNDLKVLSAQAGQFATAAAMAFVPLAKEMIPPILSGMQSLATVFKDNASTIATVTSEVVKLYAAYKGLSMMQSAFGWMSEVWGKARVLMAEYYGQQTALNAKEIAEFEKTKAAEYKILNTYYDRMQKQAQKQALKEAATAEEAVEKQAIAYKRLEAERTASLARLEAKHVAAYNAMIGKTEQLTVATNAVTVAEGRAGVAGATMGSAIAAGAVRAESAVVSLTRQVFALAGGWLAVAAAIGYALSLSAQRSQDRVNNAMSDVYVLDNGAVGEFVDGEWYARNDGDAQKARAEHATAGMSDDEGSGWDNVDQQDTENGITTTNQPESFVSPVDKSQAYRELTAEEKQDLDYKRYTAWSNTEQGRRETLEHDIESMKNQTSNLASALSGSDVSVGGGDIGGGGGGGGGSDIGGSTEVDKTAENAQKLADILKGIKDENDDMTLSAYDKEVKEVMVKYHEWANGIEELKEQGLDTKKALNDLDEWQIKALSNIASKYDENNKKVVAEAKAASLEMAGDYVGAENVRYELSKATFNKLAEEKRKEMANEKAWAEWKANAIYQIEGAHTKKVAELREQETQKVKEEYQKQREAKLNTTDINALIAYLNSEENLLEESKKSHTMYAEAVRKAWEESYYDIDRARAVLFTSMNNSLNEGVKGFIRGTKTMGEAFSSLANSILDEMAAMITRGLIMKAVLGITGIFGGSASNIGGATSAYTSGLSSSYAIQYHAGGGRISGPGSATSDSIPAMLSNGEFVVNASATKRFLPLLEQINGYSNGGMVAPSVKSYGSSSMGYGVGGAGCNVQINLTNKSGQDVTAESTGATFDGESWVVGVVLNAVSTNKSGIRNIIKGVASS